MFKNFRNVMLGAVAALAVTAGAAQAEELRLLTWDGYYPQDVLDQFTEETGIEVKLTTSNNEEMISKLRATGGAGFDLVQPSQDRIAGAQRDYGIYKPVDMSKVEQAQFIPSMLNATAKNTEVDGEPYGLPHIWGSSGLVVNTETAPQVRDYTDLCDASVAGKVSYRLKRPTLIGFAFAMGMDPFAAYDDIAAYKEIMGKVEAKLIDCKANVKTYWTGGDELKNLIRSGEVVAAMAWDAGGWDLHKDNANINFVAPASGALAWVDTFALPARGRNDDAAYAFVNFVMQPEIAARITNASSYWTASTGADAFVNDEAKALFKGSFDEKALDNVKWYPPVPAGLEEIEGKVLDRVNAAGS